MFLQWLWLFVVFSFNLAILTTIIYWSQDASRTLMVFGIKFRSVWTFWFGVVAVLSPVYCFVNYLFFYAYWFGYQKLFQGQMWWVVVTMWLASLVVTFLETWLYLGELPPGRAIIALFFLAGALITILW